jgi:DNA polymerase IV
VFPTVNEYFSRSNNFLSEAAAGLRDLVLPQPSREMQLQCMAVIWRDGDKDTCDRLMAAAAYDELKRIAAKHMAGERREPLTCRELATLSSSPRTGILSKCSRHAHEIFRRHTDLIEPLSLDEAYLDVTENKTGLPTATRVARTIREQIRQELQLTTSAGVGPNKFLAKIASDWRKPDGLFVVQPEHVEVFLSPLPVLRLPV